jgi:hypothetical protein
MIRNALKKIFNFENASAHAKTAQNQEGEMKGSSNLNGGVFSLIRETNQLSNTVASVVTQDLQLEPLPFTDYSLFEETYSKQLSRRHGF